MNDRRIVVGSQCECFFFLDVDLLEGVYDAVLVDWSKFLLPAWSVFLRVPVLFQILLTIAKQLISDGDESREDAVSPGCVLNFPARRVLKSMSFPLDLLQVGPRGEMVERRNRLVR